MRLEFALDSCGGIFDVATANSTDAVGVIYSTNLICAAAKARMEAKGNFIIGNGRDYTRMIIGSS